MYFGNNYVLFCGILFSILIMLTNFIQYIFSRWILLTLLKRIEALICIRNFYLNTILKLSFTKLLFKKKKLVLVLFLLFEVRNEKKKVIKPSQLCNVVQS